MSDRTFRALLVNPWITDFAAYDHWSKPLGLLYLAAVLRKAGAQVHLLDCLDRGHPLLRRLPGRLPPNRAYGTGKYIREILPKPAALAGVPRHFARYGMPEEIVHRVLDEVPYPDVILVTSGMTYWYPGVQMAVSLLRRRFPHTPILLGGIYATLLPDHARRHSGADRVVAGEAESKIVPVLHDLFPALDLAPPAITCLDDLPFPAWDLYARLDYAVVLTSRGCPLRCTFCASHRVSGPYRTHGVDRVVAELEYLHRAVQVRDIAFYDDALLTNYQNHLHPILQQVRRNSLKVRFHTPNGLQCRFITSEVAEELKASGFTTIRLSVESSDPHRQKLDMSHKVSRRSFEGAVRALFAAGFAPAQIDAYVMMVLPGQPLTEVLQTMAMVHGMGVGIRLAAFSPIPGTVDYDRAQQLGLLPRELDPLLTNNTCLPVRPAGLGFETFYRVALLAKNLNEHLRRCGTPLADEAEIFDRLQKEFSPRELHARVGEMESAVAES